MKKCDMVAWHALGDDSYAQDYFSQKSKDAPGVDKVGDLSTTTETYTKGKKQRVIFTTQRKLDTGDYEEDFLIPLG